MKTETLKVKTARSFERQRYFLNNPWMKSYKNFKCRKSRGDVTGDLSSLDARTLWNRDKAFEMKKPSLVRIDKTGTYTFYNCKFEECPNAG